jgi:hypothetical protein
MAVGADGWTVQVARERPYVLDHDRDTVECFDEITDHDQAGYFFVRVRRPGEQLPSLMVSQTFAPSQGGFFPGVLLVPQSSRVFVGAGERLLCYSTYDGHWVRQWEDTANAGFWGWDIHGGVVVMSAELEIAAWTADGEKLWTRFVEPPWSYSVNGSTLVLDVMGQIALLSLESGVELHAT